MLVYLGKQYLGQSERGSEEQAGLRGSPDGTDVRANSPVCSPVEQAQKLSRTRTAVVERQRPPVGGCGLWHGPRERHGGAPGRRFAGTGIRG